MMDKCNGVSNGLCRVARKMKTHRKYGKQNIGRAPVGPLTHATALKCSVFANPTCARFPYSIRDAVFGCEDILVVCHTVHRSKRIDVASVGPNWMCVLVNNR